MSNNDASLANNIRECLPTNVDAATLTLVFNKWHIADNVARSLTFQAIAQTVTREGLPKPITVRVKFSTSDLILRRWAEISPKVTIAGVQASERNKLAQVVYSYLHNVGFALPENLETDNSEN